MRIRKLDLTRYGKFTDSSIDFGPKASSGPDLHIVFGLNEAGKSTALSAYLDLLFGIEERSRYNFLHEYASMRIGGVLEFAGEEHLFTRTKQRANSLLDASGQPVGEMALSAHLAGLTRETYGTMFSLDDETLEAGGRAILESKGDLGRLLFTASAGLAQASDTLLALEAEADALHRRHASGTELALLKKRLIELKGEREAIDTLGSTFEALEAERLDATEKYDRTVAERSTMVARIDAISRLTRAIPMLVEYRRKAARLAEMPEMVSPLRTWSGSVAELIAADAGMQARISANAAELDKVVARADAIAADAAILAVSERIRGLTDRRARHVSAGLDLPGRRTELRILDNSVAASLAALGRTGHPDPHALLLPAATTGTVRSMFNNRSGIATASRTARDELAAAVEALDIARQRVGEERAVPGGTRARLEAALGKARDSGHAKDRSEAVRHLEESTALWHAGLMHLRPWSGSSEDLAKVAVPTQRQAAAWRTRLVEQRATRSALEAQLGEHERARSMVSERLASLRATIDVADDATASRARAERNDAWTSHRKDLGAETADAFALAMAGDDAIGASRLSNARELVEIRAAVSSLQDIEDAVERTRDGLSAIVAENASILKEMQASVAELGPLPGGSVSPELAVDAIEDLLAGRAAALDASVRIEAARRVLSRVDEEEKRLLSDLIAALDRVGIASEKTDGLEVVVGVAELFLARQAKLDAEHAEALRTVRTREEELAARRRALDTADRREGEWLQGITDALAGTWLESGLPATAVGGVLDQLSTLSKTLQDRDAMQLRVEKMVSDREAFLAEVAALADETREALDPEEPEQTAAALLERLEAAERARANRLALDDDRRGLLEVRAALAKELAEHETSKDQVLRAYDVATLNEVVEREEVLRDRDRLRTGLFELEERLCLDLRAEDIKAAEDLVEGVDTESLALEKLELEQRLKDTDEALKQHLVRQTRALDRLDAIGGDSAVARLDAQRRTVLLEIEEKAARYLRLRLGILAAGNALRIYRERHRSAMMTRASEAFAAMTQGHYSGLTTQPAKGGDVLIAMQSDGSSKVADSLSKGARFQLYLALRLAGYYEFAQARPPVPFIGDDIMETFDHVRSEEVLRLFGEMAKVGQVIYLTHHRHLCDIAREVVPGVAIHELG